MSNVLIGIIGVILFIGLAIAGATFFGSSITNSGEEARAASYVNESTQIARALEMYATDNGRFPMDGNSEPVTILVNEGYLKSQPPGGRSPWTWSAASRAIITPAGNDDADGRRLCVIARKRAGMPNPETILACDGSDGQLKKFDPCCMI